MGVPDRGPILIAFTLIFGFGAFVVVLLRIGYRIYRKRIDASDWLIGLALISSIVQDVLNIWPVVDYGYGKHKYDLRPSIRNAVEPNILYWLNQVFFKLTTLAAKLSLCIVYMKLFSKAGTLLIRATRWMTYFIAFIVFAAYGEAFFMSIFECTPVDKEWHKKKPGHCINVTEFRLAIGYVNVITSSLLIITPLPALAKVRRHRTEVTQLMGLILLGLIHTGCTLARLILMYHPQADSSTDPQWANTPANTLAMVEMNVGIMAACLVVMRPCFAAIYDHTAKPILHSVFSSKNSGSRWSTDKYTRATSLDGVAAKPTTDTARTNSTDATRVDHHHDGDWRSYGITKSTDFEMDSRHAGSEEEVFGQQLENPFRARHEGTDLS